jgi:hypothetical protein
MIEGMQTFIVPLATGLGVIEFRRHDSTLLVRMGVGNRISPWAGIGDDDAFFTVWAGEGQDEYWVISDVGTDVVKFIIQRGDDVDGEFCIDPEGKQIAFAVTVNEDLHNGWCLVLDRDTTAAKLYADFRLADDIMLGRDMPIRQ